jgi:hypothetical protein
MLAPKKKEDYCMSTEGNFIIMGEFLNQPLDFIRVTANLKDFGDKICDCASQAVVTVDSLLVCCTQT